jgi:hypothetical protein
LATKPKQKSKPRPSLRQRPIDSPCWALLRPQFNCLVELAGGDSRLVSRQMVRAIFTGDLGILYERFTVNGIEVGQLSPELCPDPHTYLPTPQAPPGHQIDWTPFLLESMDEADLWVWLPDIDKVWPSSSLCEECGAAETAAIDLGQQAEDAAVAVLKQDKRIKDWRSCEAAVLAQHPELRIEGDPRRTSHLTNQRYRNALSRARGRRA